MNEERWSVIPDYPNYAVSDRGSVKRLTSRNSGVAGRVLKSFLVCGYPSVNLLARGKRSSVRIHRLVAEAFVYRAPLTTEVNHIDANRANNVVTNLEWVTASGNRLHAYRTGGLSATGEDNGYSKLTDAGVIRIREGCEHEATLSKALGVSVRTIRDVRAGRTWRHLLAAA